MKYKYFFSLLFLLMAFSSSAYDFEKNGVYYDIIDTEMRSVAVAGIADTYYSGNISIPQTVTPSGITYTVSSIKYSAFANCTNLTGVSLPSSIKEINASAFENCINIKSFTIPESVTFIGNSAFKGCRELSTIYYNAVNAHCSASIQYSSPLRHPFENCLNLNYVYIGSSVEKIPNYLFAETPVKSVNIPKSVHTIESGVFMKCSALETVKFSDNSKISTIESYTFHNCRNLKNIQLPDCVTYIGAYAFYYCESLTEFPFSINSEISTFDIYSFSTCRGITELYLPSHVKRIGKCAFEDCRNLKYIYFPSNEISIGAEAFSAIWTLPNIYCTSLVPPAVDKQNGSNVDIFGNLDKSKCTLHVPKESLNQYLITEPWNLFPKVVTGISPASISIESNSISLIVGDQYKFNPTLYPWFTSEIELTYKSSNKSVADVDSTGLVHALKKGSTVITISAGSCIINANVTVNEIYATSIVMSESAKTVYIGDEFDLFASFRPDNVTIKDIVWETTDENVCTVNQNGHVAAVGIGECWILATSYNSAKSGLCKVSVNPINIESIKINGGQPIQGRINDSFSLEVLILPIDATNKILTWSIENPSIASVNESGLITFLSLGETKVKATASNGVYGECDIIVYPRLPRTFSISPESVNLNVGETFTFEAIMTPDEIDDRSITWYSDSPEIVSIDENGTVTANIPNTLVYIHGITSNGLQATASVSVNPIHAEQIKLSSENITIHCLADGEISYTNILTATVLPENTTNQSVTWSSSNEDVATYNEFFECHIAIGKPGTAILTAATDNGLSASCIVTVIQDVTMIHFDKYSYDIKVGESVFIDHTISPEDATDKTLTWLTSDPFVAIVEDGIVTGVGKGTASIKAIAQNGVEETTNITVSEEAGINDVLDGCSLSIMTQDRQILINGAKETSIVYVYNPSGQIVYCGDSKKISLNCNGVFIVKVENQVFKIVL